jgi:hypothetical protein
MNKRLRGRAPQGSRLEEPCQTGGESESEPSRASAGEEEMRSWVTERGANYDFRMAQEHLDQAREETYEGWIIRREVMSMDEERGFDRARESMEAYELGV